MLSIWGISAKLPRGVAYASIAGRLSKPDGVPRHRRASRLHRGATGARNEPIDRQFPPEIAGGTARIPALPARARRLQAVGARPGGFRALQEPDRGRFEFREH